MKYNPSNIKEVTLDGRSLVFEEFIAAARFQAPVKIAPEALERMQQSRELTEKIQKSGCLRIKVFKVSVHIYLAGKSGYFEFEILSLEFDSGCSFGLEPVP